MTVRLTVDRAAWLAHVHGTAAAYGHGLVPVVKGNGYGFGRHTLHEVVRSAGAAHVCVGDVHELHDVPAALTPVVLTPTLAAPSTRRPVLTVGSLAHVEALRGWHGRVMVKLASSMRRYGATADELPALRQAVHDAGLHLHGFALHLPLAGDDTARLAEIDAWLPHLPADAEVWVSHLTPASFHAVQTSHPGHRWAARVGTALWHSIPKGDFLHLSADVLQVTPAAAGDAVGYRHASMPFDGHVVAIGAGTAHGIAPLDAADPARRSPFHFRRTRLVLLEAPHMHTSLVAVPIDAACPAVGDRVDVQRPLTTTVADEIEWT
jgi:alanine racemase